MEVGLLTMLTIPWIPSVVWNVIFKNKLSRKIERYSKIYSLIIVSILLVLFVDSIHDMIKYSYAAESSEEPTIWAQSDVLISSSRLFLAERNFYLVGSTLFLFLVIRRTAELILRDAKMKASMANETELQTSAIKEGAKAMNVVH